MSNKGYQISGTTGIDQNIENTVSFGHYQRNNAKQQITGRAAHNAPIDTVSASETVVCQPATKKLAEELFNKWNAALQTGSAKRVADLYALKMRFYCLQFQTYLAPLRLRLKTTLITS